MFVKRRKICEKLLKVSDIRYVYKYQMTRLSLTSWIFDLRISRDLNVALILLVELCESI